MIGLLYYFTDSKLDMTPWVWMRAIRKHILLIKLIYEQARLRLPKISMTFLLKKSKRVSCAAHYEPCEESRTMHPKGLCAVHGWLLFIWTMTMWLLYCRLWFALYFMCDQIGRPIYISMGLYLYSLIKKYIKVASTVIYPWPCGVALPPVIGNEHDIWVQAIQMHMTACLVFWIKGNISGSTC